MMKTCWSGMLVVVAVLVSGFPVNAQPMPMQGLGFLSETFFYSNAKSATADGSKVVGNSYSRDKFEAFVWSAETGIQGLGYLSQTYPYLSSFANGISADGSVIVGSSTNDEGRHEAFVWHVESGMQGLGFLTEYLPESSARGVSADGTTVVGYSSVGEGVYEAFIWTSATGMKSLGSFSEADSSSIANSISADGTTVVGYSYSLYGEESHRKAFIWKAGTGMMELGFLSENYQDSVATGISADGSTVVGYSKNDDGNIEAFVWKAESGMQGLGFLSERAQDSVATSISADGTTVVGSSRVAPGIEEETYYEAFVWTAETGMVGLGFLSDEFLGSQAAGISADGSTIVGESRNDQGDTEAFLLKLQRIIEVSVDILPSNTANRISLRTRGSVPVVIFSTVDFDARTVMPQTVRIGDPVLTEGNQPSGQKLSPSSYKLVRRRVSRSITVYDLWLYFDQQRFAKLGALNLQSAKMSLTGETSDGAVIKGSDLVKTLR